MENNSNKLKIILTKKWMDKERKNEECNWYDHKWIVKKMPEMEQ